MIDATGLLSGFRVLEKLDSKYNGCLVVKRDLAWGTYIQADGLTQSGGVVETVWKKAIKKIPAYAKDSAGKRSSSFVVRNSLILGLGGGTIAKLLMEKWPASSGLRRGKPKVKITGVEIDPLMVELGIRYLGLDTSKVDVVIADAKEYCLKLKAKGKKLDMIFVDLYCGDKFPDKFERDDFLKLVGGCLEKGGVAVFNRLYYDHKRPEAVKFGNKLEKVFSKVEWIYPTANLVFICHR